MRTGKTLISIISTETFAHDVLSYPGCACDVPAHAYTFSFEPNPEWDCFFAYAPQIKEVGYQIRVASDG